MSFRGLTGYATYTPALQRDLRELERELQRVSGKVNTLSGATTTVTVEGGISEEQFAEHVNNTSAHHTRYTNAEAAAAVNTTSLTNAISSLQANVATLSGQLAGLTTDDVTQGSNLYYTDALVDLRIATIFDTAQTINDQWRFAHEDGILLDNGVVTVKEETFCVNTSDPNAYEKLFCAVRDSIKDKKYEFTWWYNASSYLVLKGTNLGEWSLTPHGTNPAITIGPGYGTINLNASLSLNSGVQAPLDVRYDEFNFLRLHVDNLGLTYITMARPDGTPGEIHFSPACYFDYGITSSSFYGINTDSSVFTARDDGSSTNHLAEYQNSSGTAQLVIDHNQEISNFACASTASVTFRGYNTSNANFKFIKSVDSLTTSPLMEWYNDDTTRIAYMQEDGYLYSDLTGIYLTAQNTVTVLNKTISGASNTLSNLNASNLSTGTIPDARIASTGVTQHQAALSIACSQLTGTLDNARVVASNVTQHEASLTILESQITDGSVLARVGGTETISAQWTFSEALKSSKGAALHGNTVSTYIGLDNRRTFAGNFTTYSYGAYNKMQWQPGTTTSNAYAWGTVNQLYLDGGAYAGTVDFLRGGDFSVYVSTAHTVSNQLGGDFLVVNTGAGSVTNMHAIRARAQVNNASLTVGTLNLVDVYGLEGTKSYSSLSVLAGVNVNDLGGEGSANYAMYVASQTGSSAVKGNIEMAGGTWNTGHLVLNGFHIWCDGTNLYGKLGAPTGATDGTVIV